MSLACATRPRTQFHWPITLRNAAHAFLDAVLRHGMHFQKLFVSRVRTPLTASAPEDAREAFPELINITSIGTFTLNTDFKAAIKRIDDDAEAYSRRHIARHAARGSDNARHAPRNAQHHT